ncbi:hypothetical protein [Sporosarcina sp. FA15]|uniref:hypothetical protein n=1 Tax=Sporosarcina sp. FA15 TaxID=3413031 RepID=UPI003F65C07C
MTVKDFFFCYNRRVMLYLKNEGLAFLVCAYHENSLQKYWMFVRTPDLSKALDCYKK